MGFLAHGWAVYISLILVLIPGIGSRMGGASRWFRLGGVSFQPAEFSKLILVIFLAWSMSRHRDQMQDLIKGFLFYWGVVGIFIVLDPVGTRSGDGHHPDPDHRDHALCGRGPD